MSLDQTIRKLNHRRIDLFRAIKLTLATALFSPFSKFSEKSLSYGILILRMDDKVGDSVTATGFLRSIKAAYPESDIKVVAGNTSAELYRDLDFVDEVLVSKKGILNTLKLFLQLRESRYLFIINTSHILNPRVLFLCSFLPAFRKIVFANPENRIFSNSIAIDFKSDHATDRYRKTLQKIGIDGADVSYEIKLDEKDLYHARVKIEELRKTTPLIIGLNSFAGGKLRNFGRFTTEKIVDLLLKNPQVAVLSLANAGDHRILDQWIDSGQKRERWVHFSGINTLGGNMALASLCDLIITPDTAWVHIASALKKKLVAIYRKDDNPEEVNSVIWAPYKTENRVIFAPRSADGAADVNTVDVEKVGAAAFELLGLPITKN